jgi:hypothetical protein
VFTTDRYLLFSRTSKVSLTLNQTLVLRYVCLQNAGFIRIVGRAQNVTTANVTGQGGD